MLAVFSMSFSTVSEYYWSLILAWLFIDTMNSMSIIWLTVPPTGDYDDMRV